MVVDGATIGPYLATSAVTSPGERPGERFGSTVAGDVDPSGTTRIVVGAPDAGPAMRGTVRMYESDRTQSTTLRPTHTLTPQDTGSEFGGMFLSFVGEIDADGTPDVFVTDWSDAARGPSTGRAYVFSGASGARLQVFTGEAPGDCLGIGVGDAGDLDGDGRTELVFGAWRHGSAAPVAGRVYLHRADGRLWQTYTAKVMGETFGFDATGIGDLDGDGVGDLLLTSAWAPVGGARTGRVFVLAGPRRPSSG